MYDRFLNTSLIINVLQGQHDLFVTMHDIFSLPYSLTLSAPTLRNGQTHSNNSSQQSTNILGCVWPFCGVGAERVKYSLFSWYEQLCTNTLETRKHRSPETIELGTVRICFSKKLSIPRVELRHACSSDSKRRVMNLVSRETYNFRSELACIIFIFSASVTKIKICDYL